MKDQFRILPPHTAAEIQVLKASIETNGLQSPIIVDTEKQVIDGHQRRDICIALGRDWLKNAEVRTGLSTIEKKALAISLNLARSSRNPSSKQRREYASILLQANPASSDSCISSVCGLDRSTVNKIRALLVKCHKLKTVMATIGKDGKKRAVASAKRKASFQVRSAKEFAKVAPAAHKLENSLNGLVRFPHRFPNKAARQDALEKVAASPKKKLPAKISLHHSDFRKLPIKPESVDLVATDVVWSPDCAKDWEDLGEYAARWLKPDGVFVTMIGQGSIDKAILHIGKYLQYAWQVIYLFNPPSKSFLNTWIEGYRPALVFSRKGASPNFHCVLDRIDRQSQDREKAYHDWQQPLDVTQELIRRLMPRGGRLVVDPQVGTGTAAIACHQLGFDFIGGDIDDKMLEIARHRIATEVVENAEKRPKTA